LKYLVFEENFANKGRVDIWVEDGVDEPEQLQRLYEEYKQDNNQVFVVKLTDHVMMQLERISGEQTLNLDKVA